MNSRTLAWLLALLCASLGAQWLAGRVAPEGTGFEWPGPPGLVGTLPGAPLLTYATLAMLCAGLLTWLVLSLLRARTTPPAVLGPFAVLAGLLVVIITANELLATLRPASLVALHAPAHETPRLVMLAVVAVALPVGLVWAIRRRSGAATWRVIVAAIAANLATAIVFGDLVPQPVQQFTIPSASMAPTIEVGDLIRVNRWVPAWRTPRRGEVTVTRARGEAAFVRRVIALPGERVALTAGIVVVNGTPLARTPEGAARTHDLLPMPLQLWREQAPEGTSWLIGEMPAPGPNRTMAELTVPAGHVFMLGDNRDNSLDSRFPRVGPVPLATVQGPVFQRITARRDAPALLAGPERR